MFMSVCLPKVDLFAKTDYAVLSESNYDKAFNDQRKDKTFIGFTLTWNLFDGFNTTVVVNTAAQRIVSAQAAPDITLKEQRKEVGDVMRLLEDSEEDLLIERKHLDLLRMKLDISREKVRLGRMNVVAFKANETERDVQKLDVERRVEQVAYYMAKLLLQRGRK
jgi:outer membrane protein TolC